MVRVGGEGGVEDALDLRLPLQPAGHGQGVGLVPFEAHAQGAQPAEAEPAHVRRGGRAVADAPGAGGREGFVAAGGEAQHDVRVTADVLGGGMDGDVDAEGVGVEVARRAPGRVAGHRDTVAGGDGHDFTHVDQAHGERRRQLDEDEAGALVDEGCQLIDIVEPGDLAGPGDLSLGEGARRLVDVVLEQDARAGGGMCCERGGDGSQAAGGRDAGLRAA